MNFFKCKQCPAKDASFKESLQRIDTLTKELYELKALASVAWTPLSALFPCPPTRTNLLVANKDFTYFGFLYMEDGWDYSRKINMESKNSVWPTYTNPSSISWWINLDMIKKECNDARENSNTVTTN